VASFVLPSFFAVDGNGCWLLAAGDTVSSVSAAAAEPTLLGVGG